MLLAKNRPKIGNVKSQPWDQRLVVSDQYDVS
jgi:hypothetical protein